MVSNLKLLDDACAHIIYHVADYYYSLPSGYWFSLSGEDDTVFDPPEGHITVYPKHLEFGIIFPLDPFIVQVLNEYNLSLAQLMPMSIQSLRGWTLTIGVIHSLVVLQRDGAGEDDSDWWILCEWEGRLLAYPKLTLVKDWKKTISILVCSYWLSRSMTLCPPSFV